MSDEIVPLPSVDELYDTRIGDDLIDGTQDHIPLWLPYQQGDVFRGVTLAGGAVPVGVMLFMHPCTMRAANGAIRDFVTVVEVESKSPRKVLEAPKYWANEFKVMPLPDLENLGNSTHVANFMKIHTLRSSDLSRNRRVSQFSQEGRLVMQQRVVHHITRYAPMLDDIEGSTAAVESEALHQADWSKKRAAGTGASIADVEKYEAEFQEYLSMVPEPSRQDLSLRAMLSDLSTRSKATRIIQRDIADL